MRDGAYIEVSGSRFQKTGQRAFFANGQSFGLGIPLTASLTPIEASVGYRFKLKRHRTVFPYVAAGVGQYHYKETSTGSDPARGRRRLAHRLRRRTPAWSSALHEWVGLSVDGSTRTSRASSASAGVSKDAGESDLGGYAVHVKIIVGR